MRKFSLSSGPLAHFLVEAPSREEAQAIIEQENLGPNIQWSTHESLEWKRAWRRGEVKTLTATRIPKGIE